ncbi:hypothetical protein [Burkholderia sp. Ac-20379]|uniref:hypothetical protein n=1 Tax=Burkholderia sp. Ac-20379 TaxID=2703900 RepID=UPI00197F1096|nr:hypothetical protein [Burkholderia sp. Ac-20379]
MTTGPRRRTRDPICGSTRGRRRARQRGYAYIALLIGIAIIAVAAAATIQIGALYQRRMAERALLDVGDAFQRALLSYADSTPAGLPRAPRTLDDLVHDPRFPNPTRHLRRIYADPLTGRADWVLIRSPDGQGIVGIHSASRARPIQIKQFPKEFIGFENQRRYTRWVFVANSPERANRPAGALGGAVGPGGGAVPVPAGGAVTVNGQPASGVDGKDADDPFGDVDGGGSAVDGAGFSGTGAFSNGGFSGGGLSSDGGFSGSGGLSGGNGLSNGGGFSNGGGLSGESGFSNGGGVSSSGFSSGYGAAGR